MKNGLALRESFNLTKYLDSGKRANSENFHNICRCIVLEVYERWYINEMNYLLLWIWSGYAIKLAKIMFIRHTSSHVFLNSLKYVLINVTTWKGVSLLLWDLYISWYNGTVRKVLFREALIIFQTSYLTLMQVRSFQITVGDNILKNKSTPKPERLETERLKTWRKA